MDNQIIWIEIPVADFDRAQTFYETLLGTELTPFPNTGGRRSAMIQSTQDAGMGVSLLEVEGFNPSPDGVLLYFNAGNDLDGMLARVEPAGGAVVMDRRMLGETPESGYFATFHDTEGNTLALFGMG
ncbi:MAG: VOC family protein [Chloroflexota bacterium]